MLEDTLKNSAQNASLSAVSENILINTSSTKQVSNTELKPASHSLAQDVLAILALKPELFF